MGELTYLFSFYHGDSTVEFEVDMSKFNSQKAEKYLFENFDFPIHHFGNPVTDYILNCALEIFNNSDLREVCKVDGVEVVFDHLTEIGPEDVSLRIKRSK